MTAATVLSRLVQAVLLVPPIICLAYWALASTRHVWAPLVWRARCWAWSVTGRTRSRHPLAPPRPLRIREGGWR